MRAVIRETECIGCTKCIQACPVDAIIGASKQMHTVLADVCTGCEKCIPPCPINCIDLHPAPQKNVLEQKAFEEKSEQRRQQREARLAQERVSEECLTNLHQSLTERKNFIREAIARTKKSYEATKS